MSPKKHVLLIVDDEQENINLLSNILGDSYSLYQALDAGQAMGFLKKNEIHLILTDQRMPGLTGVELLEKAREVRPDCVRMLVTAYPDVNNAIQAINRGHVHRYIAKPFDSAELKLAIQQELEHLDLLRANRRLNEEMGRMVDELFRANRELRDLNQMKDQFLANCSHELKTPLVSGMGYVDLMLSGGMGPLDPRQEKGLKIAHRNLERLLGLIENLLALAKARFKPEELKIVRFDFRPLLEECVESLRARARKKSLRVKTTIPRGKIPVDGDERKIHSVITNVLANAEKFSPEDAQIEIRIGRPRAGKIRVSVTDNGVGLKETRADIQPFKTTSDYRYAGMGIGLTLARQILQQHQCDIVLEQGPHGGARVQFDLPSGRG
ncbi:MAG TPA: hybrid sensor histidine kinase/response regulator [Planctomycetota bacterium]|nr:hybrid sensor histidine kinase/response regulator [Planctomycetota bacterium]